MRTLLLVLLLGSGVLTACEETGGQADVSVSWSHYAPGLQARIDALADAKDCAGLQAEFEAADANDAATRSRTGEGNAKLMSYIEAKREASGC